MQVTLTRAGLARGVRAALPLALPLMSYGAVYGVLAQQAGASALEAMLLNVFVLAGAAQMAVMPLWQHPLPLVAITTITFLINLRLLLLSASMRPWLQSLPAKKVYPMLHMLTDESWTVSMLRYRLGERDAGVFLGSNLTVVAAWMPATLLGFGLGQYIGDPAEWGLDFAFTAVFAAMLFTGYRSRRDLAPWFASGVAAALVWWLVPGTWYVLAGGIAGVAVALWQADPEAHIEVPAAESAS